MMTSESAIRMLSELPPYYIASRVMQLGILEPEGIEIDALIRGIEDIQNQLHIQTATWSLPVWEEEYGVSPEDSSTLEERRELVMAQMRAGGTATIDALEAIASSFGYGEVQVLPDHYEFVMYTRFVGTVGIPRNIEDFKKMMRKVVPAHYALEYMFVFLTWAVFDEKGLTWDALDAANKTWDELEVWI